MWERYGGGGRKGYRLSLPARSSLSLLPTPTFRLGIAFVLIIASMRTLRCFVSNMSCATFLCSIAKRFTRSHVSWWMLRLPPPIILMNSTIPFPSSAKASTFVATGCTPSSGGGNELLLCCTGVTVRSYAAVTLGRCMASFLIGGVPLSVIFDEPASDPVTPLLGLNGFSLLIFILCYEYLKVSNIKHMLEIVKCYYVYSFSKLNSEVAPSVAAPQLHELFKSGVPDEINALTSSNDEYRKLKREITTFAFV
uniref:Uncharacterized protein n=1 Tax=Glossina brevipalpis TaxID=37001 RepID=A0A1A9X2S3_9MUSC